MRTDFKKLARQRAANLAAHGGDPLKASLAHHERRLADAVRSHDYATQRDAAGAIADLKARL